MTSAAPASAPAPIPAASPPGAPLHVAIIMDGNGRWAAARGLPRQAGHERGVEAVRRTVEAARELGVTHMTLFSFSTENWRRPPREVRALFALLKAYVNRDLARLHREGVRVRILGSRGELPDDIAAVCRKAEEMTAANTRFELAIAFNYGGRGEILRAAKALAERAARGEIAVEAIGEADFAAALDTGGMPEPDVMIRTSGECRISNFLLWQLAYTELVFTDVLWPDFGRDDLAAALHEYKARDRRFGDVASTAP